MSRQCPATLQYAPGRENDNLLTQRVPDLSSSHPTVSYRLLNWSDAECPTASTALRHILEHEIDGDLILGADLVHLSFIIYTEYLRNKAGLRPRSDSPLD